ncbi:MAG TPA: C45 family autoproteolytic acyltransferase/hydrolase [bacterium]|nr:C45 family autoproteolytic acyltransferase/hydrolase [bacterium]HPS29288.1 C45 family autoproteolytic acyltransferase/hydrolase [bacterium]
MIPDENTENDSIDADEQSEELNNENEQIIDEDVDAGPFEWTPVSSHREEKGKYIIVWLTGTPYEMGFQHGTLLKNELQNGLQNSTYIKDLKWQISLASYAKIDDIAKNNSYPEIVQECEGMVAAAGDIGWTMELCLMANFGDVIVEWLDGVIPVHKSLSRPGCSQFIVSGDATVDGRIYHGRLLDWSDVDYLLWYPVIFVRQPIDGIPHVYIGFPGNLSPYSGMNVAGISGASNESDPVDRSQQSLTGRSHVQMLGQILKRTSSLDEANLFILGEKHMSVEQFGIADGKNGIGSNFEMTATVIAKRDQKNGAVWLTNHFVDPSTEALDADPAGSSSLKRYKRLKQLLTPESEYSVHGTLNPPVIVKILRDRIDPDTMTESPLGTIDNDSSLATNGAIYAIIFDPERLHFWVASGEIPVPEQTFTGFSLSELLNLPGKTPVDPEFME